MFTNIDSPVQFYNINSNFIISLIKFVYIFKLELPLNKRTDDLFCACLGLRS